MSKFDIFCILLGRVTLFSIAMIAFALIALFGIMLKEYFRIRKEKKNVIRRNQSTAPKRA